MYFEKTSGCSLSVKIYSFPSSLSSTKILEAGWSLTRHKHIIFRWRQGEYYIFSITTFTLSVTFTVSFVPVFPLTLSPTVGLLHAGAGVEDPLFPAVTAGKLHSPGGLIPPLLSVCLPNLQPDLPLLVLDLHLAIHLLQPVPGLRLASLLSERTEWILLPLIHRVNGHRMQFPFLSVDPVWAVSSLTRRHTGPAHTAEVLMEAKLERRGRHPHACREQYSDVRVIKLLQLGKDTVIQDMSELLSDSLEREWLGDFNTLKEFMFESG